MKIDNSNLFSDWGGGTYLTLYKNKSIVAFSDKNGNSKANAYLKKQITTMVYIHTRDFIGMTVTPMDMPKEFYYALEI